MSITPEALEAEFSLTTAATRLDFLSRRDNGDTTLNTVRDDEDEDGWASLKATDTQLDVHESLELLALGEVVARKAHDSRLVGIRAALRGGADWDEIARALGVTPRAGLGRLPGRGRAAARQRRRVGRPRAGRVAPRPLTGASRGGGAGYQRSGWMDRDVAVWQGRQWPHVTMCRGVAGPPHSGHSTGSWPLARASVTSAERSWWSLASPRQGHPSWSSAHRPC